MGRYRIQVDLTSAFAPPGTCPGCGATDLCLRSDGERVRFDCAACGCSWFVEMGRAYRADIGTADSDDTADAGAAAGREVRPC